MGMRATTVRFSDDLWSMLESEADRQGISAAQFVRDATIMRIGLLAGKRGDPEAEMTVERVARRGVGRRRGEVHEPLRSVRDRGRLRALHRSGVLDTPRDEHFDRLAALAARVVNAPVALVSLVDEDRQFFKSCLGLPEPWASRRETPLSHSFCQHAVASREPLVINDAREHPVLHDNSAIQDLDVVAYAGIPLITSDGHALGTLCVIDSKPRTWTSDQIEVLRDLAASVLREIELGAGQRPGLAGAAST